MRGDPVDEVNARRAPSRFPDLVVAAVLAVIVIAAAAFFWTLPRL